MGSGLNDDWQQYKANAEAAFAAGNFAQSEALWAMAVLLAEQLGAADARLTKSLDHLSQSLLRQRKYGLAEIFLLRSWKIKTKLLPAEPTELAKTLNMVAELFFQQGRILESEQLCARVYTMYRDCYGLQHPTTVTAGNNLATVVQLRKSHDEEKRKAAVAEQQSASDVQWTTGPRTAVQPPSPQPAEQTPNPQPTVHAPAPQPTVQPPNPQPAVQPPNPQPAVQPPNPQPAVQPPNPQPPMQPPSPQPVVLEWGPPQPTIEPEPNLFQSGSYQAMFQSATYRAAMSDPQLTVQQTSPQPNVEPPSPQPTVQPPSPPPNLQPISPTRPRPSLKDLSAIPKCDVCGYNLDGEYCQRCTGTQVKMISPLDHLT